MEHQQFMDLSENWGHRKKTATTKTWHRKVNIENHSLFETEAQEQKSDAGASTGRNIQSVIDVLIDV